MWRGEWWRQSEGALRTRSKRTGRREGRKRDREARAQNEEDQTGPILFDNSELISA